ncbi:hypothetical protein DDE18_15235 [Nocardioides gansuensis]|uniref:histidine kinase n=1 Tax=Nocardioides gansuensis TaxID=2138300 RepID=A0A2T8F8P3_9ACTN|nr:ATP-binding protein [Nocardioides gansuensis]PVG82037.1 hypothetical protein DDE18_15235 [Nocardioides gansuensis]
MTGHALDRAGGIARVLDLVRRVNSSTDTAELLDEVARGVVEGLGFGVCAISRIDGDSVLTTNVAGDADARRALLGRRFGIELVLDEYAKAEHWGILRFRSHDTLGRQPLDRAPGWTPGIAPGGEPDDWHPLDALYAPLLSATGELVGNLAVDLPPGNKVPGSELRELLELFAVQAGLALSNAQQRDRLAEGMRLESAMKEVALAGSQVDLDAILATAVRAVHAGFEASQVWVRCFADPDLGRDAHAFGHPEPPISPSLLLREDLTDDAWPSRGRVVSLLLEGDEGPFIRSAAPLRELMRQMGAGRLLVSPLSLGAELMGYLVIALPLEHPEPTTSELTALHEIARELGRIVHAARVHETEQRLVTELRELDRYRADLIATISHELKTPLTSIIGHVELLDELDTGVPSVRAIERSAHRLHKLVDRLLSYSRLHGEIREVRRRFDLVELCRSTVEHSGFQAATSGLSLDLEVLDEPLPVTGDPHEVSLIVDNLVGNALKYTPRGGSVRVRVGSAGAEARVEVVDTGLGISRIDQPHVFSPFHRSTNLDALSIPGSGLGLAICRRIAEQHGGQVSVESELGRGSTFTLTLPLDTSD